MPDRRRSPEEWAAEIAARADDEEPETQPASGSPFEALTEQQRERVNDVHDVLADAGFRMAAGYQLNVGPRGPDTLTLTVVIDEEDHQ